MTRVASHLTILIITFLLFLGVSLTNNTLGEEVGEPYHAEGEFKGITEEENTYMAKALNCLSKGEKVPIVVLDYIASSEKLTKMFKILHLRNIEKESKYEKKRLITASRHALKYPAKPKKGEWKRPDAEVEEI